MRKVVMAALAAGVAVLPAATQAQNVEARVGKLESEMRAVQRKVFPGGAGQYLQPEITRPDAPQQAGGTPATSAVSDLTGRVTALEQQMASMTDQIEQTGFRLRQLQDQFDAYKRSNDAQLKSLATTPALAATPASAPLGDETGARPTTPARTNTPVAVAAAGDTAPSAAAVAGAKVDRPSTGDAPEDEYLYGYRLWAAKQYPQAEAQLKKVVADYPKHRRASWAQNLLGRAYLDEGKPSLASMAFYDNYKKMPDGERAPDSLYYLAQALMKLNKPADACKVYGELTDVYGAKISSSMKADVQKGRTAAKCK